MVLAMRLVELNGQAGCLPQLQPVMLVPERLLGAGSTEQGPQQHVVRAGELASLLYWLCIVGYHLRTLEARWDLEQSMLLPV